MNNYRWFALVCTKQKKICSYSLHKKIEVNSQSRKILLILYTNMAAMTSHANHQFIWHCIRISPSIYFILL